MVEAMNGASYRLLDQRRRRQFNLLIRGDYLALLLWPDHLSLLIRSQYLRRLLCLRATPYLSCLNSMF